MGNKLNEAEKTQLAANATTFIANGIENLRMSLINNNDNGKFDEVLKDIEEAQQNIKSKMLQAMEEAGEWANGLDLTSEVDLKVVNPAFELLKQDREDALSQ